MSGIYTQNKDHPQRIQSAPPDEGEPNLRNTSMSYNLNAKEYNPFNAAPKKQLRADAQDFVPPSKALNPNTPAFVFNAEVSEFTPSGVVSFSKPLKTDSEPISQLPVNEKNLKTKGSADSLEKTEKIESKESLASDFGLEKTGLIKENAEDIKPENLATDKNNAELKQEKINEDNTEDSQENIRPEENFYKKKVYNFEDIRNLKKIFLKDPDFSLVPHEILKIKNRNVELIKVSFKGKKGERPIKEVVKQHLE